MKDKSRVAIVGAGRLGTALALALAESGYLITALVARRRVSANRARQTLIDHIAACRRVPPIALTHRELGSLPLSEAVFITVPDDAISRVADELATLDKQPAKIAEVQTQSTKVSTDVALLHRSVKRIALHTSGARGSDELTALRERGWACGSVHPLISVSRGGNGSRALREAFYTLEGDRRATVFARRMVKRFGAHARTLSLSHKALYHAAAVTVSGHTVALFSLAIEMFERCGIESRDARRMLLPLLESTVENLKHQPPAQALTGSFARGDAATIKRHLTAIEESRIRDAHLIYAALGARALELSRQHNLGEDYVQRLKSLLWTRHA